MTPEQQVAHAEVLGSEVTLELTNYCPHDCPYCSSNTTQDFDKAVWLEPKKVEALLADRWFDHIVLSGGEPLSHPQFYQIYRLCEQHTPDVVVYSNLIRHLAYNTNVIDGVYLEASVTLTPETRHLRVLKRVEQGRESKRPQVTFSRNHDGWCDCGHHVVKPDGAIVKSPCSKEVKL